MRRAFWLDDYFYGEKVLSKIATAFEDPEIDATIGDIVFIKGNHQDNIIRRYSAKKWEPSRFAWGYMPPHPSFFARTELFKKFGNYQTDYKIAADYELMIRFLLKNQVKWKSKGYSSVKQLILSGTCRYFRMF
ncbi:hypothetical protein SAMN04488057_10619 [Cyclobacterium lianum]|uniref:Uncharacterized protein n=1 Tax=Cyclobacterium lianum TaxID=388280 RepID=A0A1M7NRP1_9BACT|nr:hypothetical protein [Cyclobacterium lianum]SHN06736.1 hypothetical protein SAMN04488057_10619 [Cyclobacterium lianum]